MLSSSLDTLIKLSKTTYPQKLFANDCVTLYQDFLTTDGGVLNLTLEPGVHDVSYLYFYLTPSLF